MKPFTLQWWMRVYTCYISKLSAYLMTYNKGFCEDDKLYVLIKDYSKKSVWVLNRIVKKYGK